MNKQQLIEKAVIDLNGEWPTASTINYGLKVGRDKLFDISLFTYPTICTREEFEATAKRMGYINGYLYGVEYPTNGKKPDLPDDVEVKCALRDASRFQNETSRKVSDWDWKLMDDDSDIKSFRITDQRYKPEPEPAPAQTKHWFEAGELPKAGTKCLCYFDDGRECWHECIVIGSIDEEIKNGYVAVSLIGKHERKLVWVSDFKPIRTEREKTIDAADLAIHQYRAGADIRTELLGALYDAGLLRLPDQK